MVTPVEMGSIYLIFGVCCIYLFVGIPYILIKCLMLYRFDSNRIYYVYQKLDFVNTTMDKMIYLKGKDQNKLNKLIEEINELPVNVPYTQVERKVQKVCRYIPDWILYLVSFLISPLSTSLVMFTCVTLGDNSFGGFFLLLGFLGFAPVFIIVILKVSSAKNSKVTAEVNYHTSRLLDFIRKK